MKTNKTKANKKTKTNKTTKKSTRQTFKSFHKKGSNEIIQADFDIRDTRSMAPTFFSLLFQYYYGEVVLRQKGRSVRLKGNLALNTHIKTWIIDYPNIIHILFDHYKNTEHVIRSFYAFVLRELKRGSRLVCVAKLVILSNENMDIMNVLNKGKQLTGKTIDAKYFKTDHMVIYNINYKIVVSSSVDDLVGHFICFVLYAYMMNHTVDPREKIIMFTNDMQYFDKNLLGKTPQEQTFKLDAIQDLYINKVVLDTHRNYVYKEDPLDSLLIRHFIHDYVYTVSGDTKHLECNIQFLLQLIHTNTDNDKVEDISYDSINDQVKKYFIPVDKTNIKRVQTIPNKKSCDSKKELLGAKGSSLLKNYYLYTLFKNTQLYLFQNNFYGSYPKKQIVDMV